MSQGNFRIYIQDDKGKFKYQLHSGTIWLYVRSHANVYHKDHIVVKCIVRPSGKLELQAVKRSGMVDVSMAHLIETDPAQDPNDWLKEDTKKPTKEEKRRHTGRKYRVKVPVFPDFRGKNDSHK